MHEILILTNVFTDVDSYKRIRGLALAAIFTRTHTGI